jgi:hypothetical protein
MLKLIHMNIQTESTQQSPSRVANKCSAGEEIPQILWNQIIHYHVHMIPSSDPFRARYIQSTYIL